MGHSSSAHGDPVDGTAGCDHGAPTARAVVLRRTPDGWTVYAAGTGTGAANDASAAGAASEDAGDARTKARVVAFFDAPPMTPQEIGALALHLWERGYAVTMQCEDPSTGPERGRGRGQRRRRGKGG